MAVLDRENQHPVGRPGAELVLEDLVADGRLAVADHETAYRKLLLDVPADEHQHGHQDQCPDQHPTVVVDGQTGQPAEHDEASGSTVGASCMAAHYGPPWEFVPGAHPARHRVPRIGATIS